MSMFAPAEFPNAAEIEKAILTAKRERALAMAELAGLALATVKDAVLPSDEKKQLAPVPQGTAAPGRAR